MGGGASSFTPEQSAALTKELKVKLEEYTNDNLEDEVIRHKITQDYNNAVKKLRQSQDEATLDSSVSIKGGKSTKLAGKKDGLSGKFAGKSAAAAGGGSTKVTKAPTRRRSFDNNANKKPLAPVVEPTAAPTATESAMVESKSTTALEPPGEQPPADSWDSVSQQPYCNLCQMAFKSLTFLERHTKFSDLHLNNVKKRDRANNPQLTEEEKKEEIAPISPKPVLNKQEEGTHFKMLYTGSKFFWRTQETVDLHFYHHILPHCIEVISYDLTKSKEMNRIYLDYTTVEDILKKQGIYQQIVEDDPIKRDEAKRTALTTYLLQRLQLQNSLGQNSMQFVKMTGDNYPRSPILEKPPRVLIPVVVTRRRRTNAEEIEATITGLTNDRAALAEATGQAEKIANLVYAGAAALSSKKWWADFNPVRKRWIWAIRRVIRQKLVAETKINLDQRAARKAQQAALDNIAAANNASAPSAKVSTDNTMQSAKRASMIQKAKEI